MKTIAFVWPISPIRMNVRNAHSTVSRTLPHMNHHWNLLQTFQQTAITKPIQLLTIKFKLVVWLFVHNSYESHQKFCVFVCMWLHLCVADSSAPSITLQPCNHLFTLESPNSSVLNSQLFWINSNFILCSPRHWNLSEIDKCMIMHFHCTLNCSVRFNFRWNFEI